MKTLKVNAAFLTVVSAITLTANEIACAAEGVIYEVKDDRGYGLDECLGEVGDCGQAVADAWCNAHGRLKALKYGQSFDLTTISVSTADPVYIVSCSD